MSERWCCSRAGVAQMQFLRPLVYVHNAGSAALKESDKNKKGKGKDPLQMELEQLKEVEMRKKRENLLKTRLRELQEEEIRMSKWSAREIQMRWVELLR